MDPCFYFDEEANEMAERTATTGASGDWLPLMVEGAVLALILAASALGLLREGQQA